MQTITRSKRVVWLLRWFLSLSVCAGSLRTYHAYANYIDAVRVSFQNSCLKYDGVCVCAAYSYIWCMNVWLDPSPRRRHHHRRRILFFCFMKELFDGFVWAVLFNWNNTRANIRCLKKKKKRNKMKRPIEWPNFLVLACSVRFLFFALRQ